MSTRERPPDTPTMLPAQRWDATRELYRLQRLARIGSWTLSPSATQHAPMAPETPLVWSPETYRLFGVPLGEDVTLARFRSLCHPEDRDRVRSAWEAALRQSGPYDVTHRIVRDDAVCWIRERAVFLRDDSDTLTEVLGTAQDVTDQVRMEHALREERQLLRNVIAGTHAGTFQWRMPDDRVDVNARLLDILGRDPGEASSPLPADLFPPLVHPDDLGPCTEQLEAHLAKRSPQFRHRMRMRHAQGHWIHILVHGQVLERDSEGLPQLMAGTVQDITAEERARESAHRTDLLLRSLFDHSPLAMVIGEGADYRTRHMNPAFSDLLGYGPEELPDIKTWWNVMFPDPASREETRARWEQAFDEARAEGTPMPPMEMTVTCRDGSRRRL